MKKAAVAFIAGTPLFAVAALAGPDRVRLPENYQEHFVNYLDVDRPDRKIVRKMYVDPDAHAAAVAGEPLPDGTVLIMEDHPAEGDGEPAYDENGRLIPSDEVGNIFVMEKNNAWSTANENWDYAWYLADGSPRPEASFDGCFSCHANRAQRDYTFTYWKYLVDSSK